MVLLREEIPERIFLGNTVDVLTFSQKKKSPRKPLVEILGAITLSPA